MPVQSAAVNMSRTTDHQPRAGEMPECPICADSMVAAEASAYVDDNCVSYLWSCETCGYGFVTKHALRPLVCH